MRALWPQASVAHVPEDEPTRNWLTPEVQALFNDPRLKHLTSFANRDDDEPELLNYDRALTLQAMAAIYSIRSSEKQGRTIARATWALVWATVGLFVATIGLVMVTVASST